MNDNKIIKKYHGNIRQLSNDVGSLRYDVLSRFLKNLAARLKAISASDTKNDRTRLARSVGEASFYLTMAQKKVDSAWKVRKKDMKGEDNA